MKTQFTKGEWRIFNPKQILNKQESVGIDAISEDGEKSILVYGEWNTPNLSGEEALANARLIAQSPKMYEHLLNIVHNIELEKETVSGALLAEMDSIKRTLKRIEL